jgi:hypothetical protein
LSGIFFKKSLRIPEVSQKMFEDTRGITRSFEDIRGITRRFEDTRRNIRRFEDTRGITRMERHAINTMAAK